jgi:hypothetical protein
MNNKHRVVRPLGRGREAVRCSDGRWRIFEVRAVDAGGGEESRRWVCVHVENQQGRWPYEFFGTVPNIKVA